MLPVFVHRAGPGPLYVDLAGESFCTTRLPRRAGEEPAQRVDRRGSPCSRATGIDRCPVRSDVRVGDLPRRGGWLAGDRARPATAALRLREWQDHDAAAWPAPVGRRKRAVRGAASIPPLEGADRHGSAIAIARLSVRVAASVDLAYPAGPRATSRSGARSRAELLRGQSAVRRAHRRGRRPDRAGARSATSSDAGRALVAWSALGQPETTRHLQLSTSRKLPCATVDRLSLPCAPRSAPTASTARRP